MMTVDSLRYVSIEPADASTLRQKSAIASETNVSQFTVFLHM